MGPGSTCLEDNSSDYERRVLLDFVNDFDKIICEVTSVLGKPLDKTIYDIVDTRNTTPT